MSDRRVATTSVGMEFRVVSALDTAAKGRRQRPRPAGTGGRCEILVYYEDTTGYAVRVESENSTDRRYCIHVGQPSDYWRHELAVPRDTVDIPAQYGQMVDLREDNPSKRTDWVCGASTV